MLTIGADYSSNSNRLREIAEEAGAGSRLIPDAGAIDPAWFEDARTVGITAGASAPETLVRETIERLAGMFDIEVAELDGVEENVTFNLPPELRDRREGAGRG